MNNNFYFNEENENTNGNNPPEVFENAAQSSEAQTNIFEEEILQSEENVQNQSYFSTEQNPFNTAKNGEFNQPFQHNYYGYQHSYQPYYESSEATQLFYEKRAVKRTSNHIGLGLILFFALQFAISYFLAIFMLNKNALEFISNPAINLELNILISILGFGLSGLFILKLQKARLGNLLSFSFPKKGSLLPAIMTGVGFCYVANIVVSLLQARFQNILPFAQPEMELPSGGLGFLLSVLAVAVAPALIEEFFFRGVIMGSLLKFSKPFAIFVSAFLFALVHGNLVQIPFAFLVGLVIGALVIETNSFWTGVIIHFINNFLSVCMDYLSKCVDEGLLNVIYLFLLASIILVGFFGYYILSIKNKKLFSFEKPQHISTSVTRFGWFSCSAAMIIYFAIIFFEVVLVQISA